MVKAFFPAMLQFSSYNRSFFCDPLFCLGKRCCEGNFYFLCCALMDPLYSKPPGELSLASESSFSATSSSDSSLLPRFLKGVASLLFFLRCLPGSLCYGRCRKHRLAAWAAFGEGKGPVGSSTTLAGACLLCKGLL